MANYLLCEIFNLHFLADFCSTTKKFLKKCEIVWRICYPHELNLKVQYLTKKGERRKFYKKLSFTYYLINKYVFFENINNRPCKFSDINKCSRKTAEKRLMSQTNLSIRSRSCLVSCSNVSVLTQLPTLCFSLNLQRKVKLGLLV